jgi:hypothetical protein
MGVALRRRMAMKFSRGMKVVLGLLLAVVLSVSVNAQSYNAPIPGNAGGFDPYGNSYPPYGKIAFPTGAWSFFPACFVTNSPVATITIASPGVISVPNSCAAGQGVVFSTTSALPTGLTAGTIYYVIAAGLSTTSFEVSATVGGAAVNTSGSQSGIQTVSAVYTNATTSNTPIGISPPIPPGLVVPGKCIIPYQETNASETFTLAASVSNSGAVLQTMNLAHTGAGGATVADIATTVTATTATTATSISGTIGGGTANTTYVDIIYFTLTTQPTQTVPTQVTLYALGGSSSYSFSFMPGGYCTFGY